MWAEQQTAGPSFMAGYYINDSYYREAFPVVRRVANSKRNGSCQKLEYILCAAATICTGLYTAYMYICI